MRIERVGENKIKVVVSSEDIEVWKVDLKTFTSNTPEAQNMFWYALKQAEDDVDFIVGQSQLLVETMPLGEEGYLLIISRLETDEDVAEALVRAGKRARQAEFRVKRRARSAPLMKIFKFDDFESVCQGVSEIHEVYVGESKLFKYEGEFYLELLPMDTFGLFEIENILSEFSERVKKPLIIQGVLNEHGVLMIPEDATEIISKNFRI